MREGGIAALSMEGIAAGAGVGKTTIYRWWPSKGAVAVEALLDAASPGIRFPARGDSVWADLRELLIGIAGLMSDPSAWPTLRRGDRPDPDGSGRCDRIPRARPWPYLGRLPSASSLTCRRGAS